MSDKLAPNPCGSCPYRRDVPSGVWHEHEYDKLPGYDLPTYAQPLAAFFCHQQNGKLCAGWVGCHDMSESMGLRMAASIGILSEDDFNAALDYTTPVELFLTGAEAAAHGKTKLAEPDARGIRTIQKLTRKQGGTHD